MTSLEESAEIAAAFQGSRWFYLACAGEASLALVAAALGYFFNQSPIERLYWQFGDFGTGLAAALPPFLFFVFMLRKTPRVLQDILEALERTARPLFGHWSILQLAAISIAAGVGEELLFRGFVQEKLAGAIGSMPALLAASVLFGCVHPITRNYALVTAVIGVYLGGLMIVTGNLLPAVVAHAAYDFAALVYFLRIHDSPGFNKSC